MVEIIYAKSSVANSLRFEFTTIIIVLRYNNVMYYY